MTRHGFKLLAQAAAGVLLLAACGGSSAPAASSAAGASAGGQELTYAVAGFGQEKFDPSQTTNPMGSPASLGGPIFEQLYVPWGPNGDPKPYLLESGTLAPDGLSWTLKLRDGITFSNGDPLTADDVKFSLDRYISPESASMERTILRDAGTSVAVVDKLTVKVSTKKPLLDLPYLLVFGSEGIVLPSKYIQQVGWDEFNKKPIGSGPYVLTDHKPGQSVTYEPNPHYWRSTPTLKKITTIVVPEEQTRIAMLQSGKADMAQISPSSKQQVEASGLKTLVVHDATTYQILFFGACCDYPDSPLKKVQVRKALTISLDDKALLDALSAGLGEIQPVAEPPNPALGLIKFPAPAYDPAQAKQLLAQAGYPNGFPLKFWATNAVCSAEQSKQFAEAVAGYWQKIGVNATVTPVEYAALRPKVINKPNAADVVGTAATFCGPGGGAERTLTTFYYTKGNFQMTDVADKEVEQVLSATNPEEQKKLIAAAYQKVYDNYATIVPFFGDAVFAGNSKIEGYPLTRTYGYMLSWWVKDKPQ